MKIVKGDLDLTLIKELFNIGKLKLIDAQWCQEQGYDVICRNGKVESILQNP